MLRAALISLGVCVSAVAAAQPAPPPDEAPPANPVPERPAIDLRGDVAWRLYHDAFTALVRGQRRRAADLVASLQREHVGHPAAVLVASSPLGGGPGMVDAPRRGGWREEPSSGARAELALFQTLHGLVVGVELCVLVECDSGSAGLGMTLAGGTLGAVVSLNIGELTSGQRALLNSGTAWGAINAGLLVLATEPDEAKAIVGGLLAGQGLGVALGAAMFKARPTSGQVALANSGGQWLGALTGLTIAAAAPDMDSQDVAVALLAAVDSGIAVGGYLAFRFPEVSRAQTLVIDAGGIAGAVGGGGIGVLISGDTDDRATPAFAALGAAVGLGAAAYFTRGWGDRDGDDGPGVHAIVMPAPHGQGGLAGLAGSW